jgi:transposase
LRRRAHAILLRDAGKSVNEIASIFEVRRNTVTSWVDRWAESGPAGLGDAARPGAPPSLTPAQTRKAVKLIKKKPESPNQVLNEIKKLTGKKISRSTLRRIARRAGLRWKRMRRSVKSRRDPDEFDAAKAEIQELKELEQTGALDLYYFDEAGFTLVPSVRYGWQPIGETLEIPSRRSKQLNVLGFLRQDSQLTPYTVEGSVDAETVIACFDDFYRHLEKPSVIIIDNASPHSSKKFEARIEQWKTGGMFIYFLPPYCPELNLIEILWRMIKYKWLPLKAYESFKSLVKEVGKVLSEVGSRYTINFAGAAS